MGTKLFSRPTFDLELGSARRSGRCTSRRATGSSVPLSWGEGIGAHPRSAPECDRNASTPPRSTGGSGSSSGEFPDHPWRVYLQRSALVLKGLTYEPDRGDPRRPDHLPARDPGGERNWDYRFSWIRDSTFALWSLHSLGFDLEAEQFMRSSSP